MVQWSTGPVVRDGRPGQGIRLAVAGASHWHLPRYAHSLADAGVTFTGVSDPDPAIAEHWARELGCAASASVEALLDRAKPEVVLALGRVVDMPAQTQRLIEAEVGILAEKPLGCTADDVAPLADLAAVRGAWCAVALVLRYDPLWPLLDELRQAGHLAAISHAHVRLVNGPPQRYVEAGAGWMLERATSGGGALRNLGIHGVDLFRHLLREEAIGVAGAATSHRTYGTDVEEFGAVTLRSAGGTIGTVEAGYTYPDATAGMTRSGDNEIRVGAGRTYLLARDEEITLVTTSGGEHRFPERRAGDRYRDWTFDSLARWRQGAPPVAGIADCLAAMRLLDRAYTLADTASA